MDHSVCCIKECDKPSVALGLCVNHWRRNRRYGSPIAVKHHAGMFQHKTAPERFEMMVRRADNGCWLWKGSTDKDGYGIFRAEVNGQVLQRAHRYSWAVTHGVPIPRYAHVCHTCDTPACANPAHLFLGSALDNMRDKIEKGRARVAFGEDAGPAKLSEAQARAVLIDPRAYSLIANEYGIAASTVGNLKAKKSWARLEGHAEKPKRVSPRRGKSDKITPEIVREIREGAQTGKVLAEKFGVTRATICDIQKRRSWAHIE